MAYPAERHAAWHPDAYAVYALTGTTRVFVGRATTFFDAFDVAADYLDRQDPARDGSVPGLEIVEDPLGQPKTVWSYDATAPAPSFDPIAKWGFRDWRGPERRFGTA
jgi:hypothetical protein